ncbi:hypothetical protein GDO81_016433 [Engystomops pustulosus]|uniref:Interferon-induced transmembrane protein 3 n=1 Tax=Engystomops pustulosus TaxID=76066 RepID=A0AAV7AWM6_ENGPU|nr:hypothetical protein GDO81_016433 [Engystomops pustulosus]
MDSGGFSLPPYTIESSENPIYSGNFQPGNAHSTVVVVQEDAQLVRDDFIWSIFNTIYCNSCCLGFVALSYSVKSRDRKLFNDGVGARQYGATARKLNIAATTVTVVLVIFIIILYVCFLFSLIA